MTSSKLPSILRARRSTLTAGVLIGCAALTMSACGNDAKRAAAPTATVSAGTPPPSSTSIPTSTATPTVVSFVGPGPWERTEEREPCSGFSLLRNPYFGDLHVHTRVSADAYIYGTRSGPVEAYAFARGAPITLADDNEEQTRTARIERPLDFAAVTDHSEFFGETRLCTTPGSLIYDEDICLMLRAVEGPDDRFEIAIAWLFPAGIPRPPPSLPICETPGVDCDAAAVSAWQDIQAAAEGAYDRTDTCTFTTFIGYEHTASPFGRHLHRNIIFRNHHVPAFAASQLETFGGGIPRGVWSAIEDGCINTGTGCDAVIIPHNSNLSGGDQWKDPTDSADAQRRQDLEPLAEIHQIKGNSECRFDRQAGFGVGNADELCVFEQLALADERPGTEPMSPDLYPARNMIRNTLKDGVRFEQTLGVNPFKYGFTGSTDTHNASPGNTDETNWEGGQGNSDSSPLRQIGGELRTNPGGLTVAWAEENSRDAIFAALRRRETYATSGTRPVVRFFAGALDDVTCGSTTMIESAYETGTPMGGDLGAVRGDRSPRFAVLAFKDPGTMETPGTDLQRIQIIKGWVDDAGETHEQVFDVAGDAANGAGVDADDCTATGAGASELCNVWQDPAFDPTQPAFYYARVLENPTCRWSTRVCKSVGVDPFSPNCHAQAEAVGESFLGCCLGEADDKFLSPTIQERAWTSPIWYHPDGIATVDGSLALGTEPGTDQLTLTIRFGRVPAALGEQRADLVVRLTDDDDIFEVTLPAGTVNGPGNGPLPEGVRRATFEADENGAGTLRFETEERDLANADRSHHVVTVGLESGTYKTSYTRLWKFSGTALTTASNDD